MPRRFLKSAALSLCVGAFAAANAGPAGAVLIGFHSDTGEVTLGGAPVTALGGTPFTTALDGNIRKWFFAGDLAFGAGDIVTGTGSNGISLVVGNNVTIAPGATFDFSAIGKTPGAGGGAGGDSGRGGRETFSRGGAGGSFHTGGRGGDGSNTPSFLSFGEDGFYGNDGSDGRAGGNDTGVRGGDGGKGINNAATTGGQGGAAGSGGDGGSGGAGGKARLSDLDPSAVGGLGGLDGALGTGGLGGLGGLPPSILSSAAAGRGTDGTHGAFGFDGGRGLNPGGAGDPETISGGGAAEILALGRIDADGVMRARGGDATAGATGQNGSGGASGSPGFDGQDGFDGGDGSGGDNAPGGGGGDGADGELFGFIPDAGIGFFGAPGFPTISLTGGGDGAGGAGGTIKLKGSVTGAGGATIDTGPGLGTGGNGGDGRFLFGSNTAGGLPAALFGAQQTAFAGTRGVNPFILGGALETPFIPDLFGGAELFGRLGLDANAADFAAVRGGAPADAVAALFRMDIGPAGFADDFLGFDMLLMLNLTGGALLNPLLGIDPAGADGSFLTALLQGGVAANPLFGGAGPGILDELGAFEIYGTLIPENGTLFNAAFQGTSRLSTDLGDGDFAFLTRNAGSGNAVPEPGTMALLAIGLAGLAVARRRRRAA